MNQKKRIETEDELVKTVSEVSELLAHFVQRVENSIQWISRYQADKMEPNQFRS